MNTHLSIPEMDILRFSRQLILPGWTVERQAHIAQTTVKISGSLPPNIASSIVTYFIAAGFKTIRGTARLSRFAERSAELLGAVLEVELTSASLDRSSSENVTAATIYFSSEAKNWAFLLTGTDCSYSLKLENRTIWEFQLPNVSPAAQLSCGSMLAAVIIGLVG